MPTFYLDGLLGIWKNTNLTPAKRRIEQQFAAQLQQDLAASLRAYRCRNGRILDTDLARALSEDWNRSNQSRARYTSAVHNPVSALIHALEAGIRKALAQLLTRVFASTRERPGDPAAALLPWVCDRLLSEHSRRAACSASSSPRARSTAFLNSW